MLDILYLTTLFTATLFALTAATAIQWLLLRGAFHLMAPATGTSARAKGNTLASLTRGATHLTRAYTPRR
ncbi:MAG: hypothetical protein NVS9B4_05360 [Candidatus Acidiferrum sp.]